MNKGSPVSIMKFRAKSVRRFATCLPVLFAAVILGCGPASAAEGQGESNASPPSGTNAALRQISTNVFELGQVRLDKARRSITFPAVLNMNAGLAEYLLVTTSGKTHESLLRTDVPPLQIHLAMLLLGAKGAGGQGFPTNTAKALPGEAIRIELTWTNQGKEVRVRAEETIRNREHGAAMTRGPWTYTGSRLIEGLFIAQEVGSIVSLIEDPDALVNNPRPGRENDEIWEMKPAGLPEIETPVQVIFTLESKPAPQSAPTGRAGGFPK